MELSEVVSRVDDLSKQIDLIDSNIKFNITVFLGLMALFVAIAGWALYLFAKSIVEKSVQTKLSKMKDELGQEIHHEIKPIKDEVYELKGSLDQRIIQLIESNSKIRWASGSINIIGNNQIYIGGLNGSIDWESPITNVRVRDTSSKTEVPFEIVEKGKNHFAFKIDKEIQTNYLEWIIVWYEKQAYSSDK